MAVKDITLNHLHDNLKLIHQEIGLLRSEQRIVSEDFDRLQQLIKAEFKVVNERFDRLEDRFDQIESNITYQH